MILSCWSTLVSAFWSTNKGDGELPVTLNTAALGRTFTVGQLYDETNNLLLSPFLWNTSMLEKSKTYPQPYSNTLIETSDSQHESMSIMNVGGSLQLDVMAGKFKLKGSASYANMKSASSRTSSVTMRSSKTSRTVKISADVINPGSISYPELIDQKWATHVVTEVTYGADAYFKFKKTFNENEDKKHIAAEMKATIRLIGRLSASVGAEFEMTDEQKKTSEEMACEFVGDYSDVEMATTFNEAVEAMKEINKRDDSEHVPIRVILTPLWHLDNKANRLVREISSNTVEQSMGIISFLAKATADLESVSEIAVKHDLGDYNVIMSRVLGAFKAESSRYKYDVVTLLPKIRGRGEEEKDLIEVFFFIFCIQ